MLKRLCGAACVALVAFGSMSLDQAGASTASAAAPQVPVQRTCDDYIPRDLALSVPSAAPGQTITITGLAYPGDTVTIRIATLGGPPIVLGTAVANAAGFFSAQITIPADFVEGTYNITVSSPNCEGVTTITIVVRYPQGRCTDRRIIQAQRGDTVVWELLGVLDTTKPLTVTLVPIAGGPSIVVYTGPYPASGDVTFVVPASLANGRYRIVESGAGLNGKPLSARCGRLRVRGGGGGGTTTTTSTTSTTIPGGSSTTSTTSTTIPGGTCETSSQAFAFDGTRLIDFDGYNAKVEYTGIVPVSLGAGSWNISQAVSRDTYPARAGVTQLSEVWEIEFLDAGGNVLAHSAPTGDVPDMVVYGEWVGPLGAVSLPAGVVGVRAHHLPDLYPDGPDGPANSVVPISFVICQGGGGSGSTTTTTNPSTTTTTSTTVPGSTTTTSTTVPGSTSTTSTTAPGSTTTTTVPGSTSTTSTTAPGSTSTTTSTTSTTTSTTVPGGGGGASTTTTSTTVPGATTTTTTVPVVPTSVAGAVENQQVTRIGSNTPTQVAGNSTSRSSGNGGSGLATTGSTVRPLIALAVGLIAVGALIALGARRRRD